MSAQVPHPPRRGPGANAIRQEILGPAMALAGSLLLLGLVYISNAANPFAERLLFALGLAMTSLISALAQVLVIGGVVILWRAARRGRRDA